MSQNEIQQHNATIPVKGWTPDRRFIVYEYAKPAMTREGGGVDRRISAPTSAESKDAMDALIKMVEGADKT
ncbi:hypothetical protein [Acidisphaera sp. S103]|uniref:hypothetical protein n=1 Tax=Acidisphaera sp. S103 TaxID=1747223 RepID=UPI00131E19C6|nr:hypothetical protein [Acidisphaera sp. S103]